MRTVDAGAAPTHDGNVALNQPLIRNFTVRAAEHLLASILLTQLLHSLNQSSAFGAFALTEST